MHPHLLPILDAGEDDGRHFIAVAYAPGGSLADRLEGGPLELDEVVRIAAEIASGLDTLNESGIVHRDIKSSNVVFDEHGGALLMDFGLAKGPAYTRLTRPGQVMGTLDYLAPELIKGEPATPATDLYAFGCMVFECVTGEVPFADRGIFQVGLAHLQDPPPHPSERRAERAARGRRCRPRRAREGTRQAAGVGVGVRTVDHGGLRREIGVTAFIARDGALEGQRFELDGDRTIGREGADITLDDDQVSRSHARVSVAGATITIEDLGSTNGTFVNGAKIEAPTTLAPGDTVRIGATTFALEAEAEAEPEPEPMPAMPEPAVTVAREAAPAQPAPEPAPAPRGSRRRTGAGARHGRGRRAARAVRRLPRARVGAPRRRHPEPPARPDARHLRDRARGRDRARALLRLRLSRSNPAVAASGEALLAHAEVDHDHDDHEQRERERCVPRHLLRLRVVQRERARPGATGS